MSLRWWWSRPRVPEAPSSLPCVSTPVLHVEGPGQLALDGARIIVTGGSGTRQVALLDEALELVICHGSVDVSGQCLAHLAARGVSLSFVTRDGSRLLSRLEALADSRLPSRVAQMRVLIDEASRTRLACGFVAEKIRSQAAAARHFQRQGRAVDGDVIRQLGDFEERSRDCRSVESLMGLEGTASALWFRVFGSLVRTPWKFDGRSRRPPRDPVNSLLSLGYTLLHDRVATAVRAAGMEPALGALHAFRPGRMSLACDLMEPLRIPVVDRWVLAACNQRRFDPGAFEDRDGACLVGRGLLPKVVADWERSWHEHRWPSVLGKRVADFIHELRRTAESLGLSWRPAELVEAKSA
jgi:CRISPR-associated protein Cas1